MTPTPIRSPHPIWPYVKRATASTASRTSCRSTCAPTTEDSNTLQNNNTAISNYANNQIAKWVQKGGVDKEWDAYVKKVSEPTLGLDANIKIWQKWYDKYTK